MSVSVSECIKWMQMPIEPIAIQVRAASAGREHCVALIYCQDIEKSSCAQIVPASLSDRACMCSCMRQGASYLADLLMDGLPALAVLAHPGGAEALVKLLTVPQPEEGEQSPLIAAKFGGSAPRFAIAASRSMNGLNITDPAACKVSSWQQSPLHEETCVGSPCKLQHIRSPLLALPLASRTCRPALFPFAHVAHVCPSCCTV